MQSDSESIQKFLSEITSIAEDRGETKDKAFTAWIAENILGIEDSSVIDETIEVGGSNDLGIDFFYINNKPDEENSISWGQAKFSEDLNHTLTREEFEDFVNTIDRLEDPLPSANSVFKDKAGEFATYKNYFKKRMILVFTGSLSQQVKELLNDLEFVTSHKDPDVEWEILDLDKILQHVTVATTLPLSISYDSDILVKKDEESEKQSVIGFVKAKEIVRICTDNRNRNRVFLENPRESLGVNRTNKGIMETLQDERQKKKFWKLNNGITATCSDMRPSDSSYNTFEFDNFKIVNGRQTTWALTRNRGLLDDSVTVQLIVHHTADDDERDKISRTTNTQNPIKATDIVTNYSALRNLNLDFKRNHTKWFFEIQRGGYRVLSREEKTKYTIRRRLEKEPMARRYWAYNRKPHFAINVPEKELFLVDKNFEDTFGNSKAFDFILPHIFYTILDELDKKWKNDSTKKQYWKYLHKRIVKFYILSFISHTLSEMDPIQKGNIEKKIYELFTELKEGEPLPKELFQIGEMSFNNFMLILNSLTSGPSHPPMDEDELRKFLIHNDYVENLLSQKMYQNNTQPDPIYDALTAILSE